MKYLLIFCVLIIIQAKAIAQGSGFITNGSIEYEKKVNVFALIRKSIEHNDDVNTKLIMSREFARYGQLKPQFRISRNRLVFAIDKTSYFNADSGDEQPLNWMTDLPMATQNNIIYSDYGAHTYTSQKKILDDIFLVKDSLRKIQWRITNETQIIAGYTCRRANALILDSIYAVAFYTDKIPISGGPESFTGLPGMILGVALPYEHTSWFATEVNLNYSNKALVPPDKGKIVTDAGFRNTLQQVIKSKGRYGAMFWKAFLL